MREEVSTSSPVGALDQLALDLVDLRAAAGNPSYAEIVLRIDRQRRERGVPADEARPGRTTVYDAFRAGRRRVDVDLVVEIVRALGADEGDVAAWAERCRASAAPPPPGPAEVAPPPGPVVARVGTPARLATLLVCSLALNLVGRILVNVLDLPLHLDMTGTAITAVVAGPWWGALVGVATNGVGAFVSGPASLPFALVNVAGALVWGYGVRRYRMADSVARFFALNLAVATACSLVAVPIIWVMFGGEVGFGQDAVTEKVLSFTHVMVVAVFVSNLLISVLDKMISGFIALAVLDQSRSRTPAAR
ncbi:hypothetical protein F0U44_07875 [Nocardioides humilatus]|uniref:ECF transporter S component n=1 Tax=Nocardioides humilatus TaxID=2607660 RepID=A0A5B1LI28_9ACTN|nr:hypothetical protein [Nocardioides humilatus]KAA1420322.1 hypothetical protein F0U44_07875 [Nocardioides humilatus]